LITVVNFLGSKLEKFWDRNFRFDILQY